MSAGPSGCRELRSAISPPGRPASSTQVPWELLWRLFSQVTSRRSLAGIPLRASCMAVPLSFLGLIHYALITFYLMPVHRHAQMPTASAPPSPPPPPPPPPRRPPPP